MEMAELQKTACYYAEGKELWFEPLFYSSIMKNYAYYLRCGKNLTYHGELITTKERFIEICKKERWPELLRDSTAKE